jgi:hypothetical protein
MSDTSAADTPRHPSLRDLPLPARIVLAVFLISVGIGYISALIQLHFQHASPGSPLPSKEDAVKVFHGHVGAKPQSKIEALIVADESQPFNGTGQMVAAFTKRSVDAEGNAWSKVVRDLAKLPNGAELEKKLRAEREGERQAMLAWLHCGNLEQAYDRDEFQLPAAHVSTPLTADYFKDQEKGTVKIKSLFNDRCVRCHKADGEDAEAAKFTLDTWDKVKPYVTVQESSAMSLTKLAQTTHVHLLGFSMLYGLTGLILAFSTYPGWMRFILCPLPLVAQVIDISCWWLARMDPTFAHVIVFTGGIVAMGLMLHIVLSLLNMFGVAGKLVLLLLFLVAGGGGFVLKTQVIDPFLAREKEQITAPSSE